MSLSAEKKTEIFLHGLHTLLEKKLREELAETVKRELDTAINNALEELQISIQKEYNHRNQIEIIQVILDDRRGDKNES